MRKPEFKNCLILGKFTWTILLGVLASVSSSSAYVSSQNDPNDHCKMSSNYGIYGRFCCKEKPIPTTTNRYRYSTMRLYKECEANVSANNPNDDLATLMWRTEACGLKNILGLTEKKIDFKSYVKYLTQNYTTENNVQKLVQEANKKCPEGDREAEFHKKIAAYSFCFYKNEEKTCEELTENGAQLKKSKIDVIKSFYNFTTTCPEIPGRLDQNGYCCKGKITPDYWMWGIPPRDEETSQASLECQKQIKYLSKNARINSEKAVQDRPQTDRWFVRFYTDMSWQCHTACSINPVVFKNDSTSPEIKFDIGGLLETRFKPQNSAMRKDLKTISLKHKNSFKAPVTFEHYQNRTGITLDEIETQYSASKDQITKMQLYCAYYRSVEFLASHALNGYCVSEEYMISLLTMRESSDGLKNRYDYA